MRDLTDEEIDIMGLTRELVNGFANLNQSHPADMEEFVTHIHAIQNIILARPATESARNEPV